MVSHVLFLYNPHRPGADLFFAGFSGAFLDDCHPKKPLEYASDPANGKKLWELTEKILGEKFSY
jgi:hypothetical protein